MLASSSLREKALQMLSRREHTRAEMRSKLSRLASEDEVNALLDRLSELGLLSDERFAESFVRNRAPRLGQQRLASELRQRGVDAELAAEVLATIPAEDELTRARQVWARKFGAQYAHADETPSEDVQDKRQQALAAAKEYARQGRFLASRGFSAEVVRQVLRERGGDEPA